MAGETVITVVGNLTADPDLRHTSGGTAVANLTVASTPRTFDKAAGEWTDGNTLFLRGRVWREVAENVTATLRKGDRVIVQGALGQREYEKDGEKRISVELDIYEIGAALKYVRADIARRAKGDGRSKASGTTTAAVAPVSSGGFDDEEF